MPNESGVAIAHDVPAHVIRSRTEYRIDRTRVDLFAAPTDSATFPDTPCFASQLSTIGYRHIHLGVLIT